MLRHGCLLAMLVALSIVSTARATVEHKQWPSHVDANHIRSVAIGHEDAPLTVMFVCGMHARESITTQLCSAWAELLQGVEEQAILDQRRHMRFVFVADANPEARALRALEPQTLDCWRGNANGVDLNRNWPSPLADTCSATALDDQNANANAPTEPPLYAGDAPFSEWETRAIDEALHHYAPDMLFSVHSGSYALMTPYDACDMTPHNYPTLVQLARWLRHGVCEQCFVAKSPQVMQYYSPGSLTDYAYHVLNTSIVYTLEVYEMAADAPRAADTLTCERAFSPRAGASTRAFIEQWLLLVVKLLDIDEHDYALLLTAAGVDGSAAHE